MANNPVAIAIEQIENVKEECRKLQERIRNFSPPDEHGHYSDTFRLIATPMLYSIWERCFTICHAVALRLIRDVTTTAGALAAEQRAVWLLKSPFYNSLVDKLRDAGRPRADTETMKAKTKKGEFSILCEFLPELDAWLCAGLNTAINTDELVMKSSNVNPEVVGLNARSIGIDGFDRFKALKFGRLHDLVGQRNGIGHGAIIEPPSNDAFKGLFDFTENLVKDYCAVFIEWIESTFPEDPRNP